MQISLFLFIFQCFYLLHFLCCRIISFRSLLSFLIYVVSNIKDCKPCLYIIDCAEGFLKQFSKLLAHLKNNNKMFLL